MLNQTQQPDEGEGSAPERVATFHRQFAECLASEAEQRKYWARTRDSAAAKIAALKPKIDALVGPDRDDLTHLDEDALRKYMKLRNLEREQENLEQVARSMLDKFTTSSVADWMPHDGEEEDGSAPTAK